MHFVLKEPAFKRMNVTFDQFVLVGLFVRVTIAICENVGCLEVEFTHARPSTVTSECPFDDLCWGSTSTKRKIHNIAKILFTSR